MIHPKNSTKLGGPQGEKTPLFLHQKKGRSSILVELPRVPGCWPELLDGLGADLLAQQLGKGVQAHGAQILAGAVPDGDGAVLHIPVAHHQPA